MVEGFQPVGADDSAARSWFHMTVGTGRRVVDPYGRREIAPAEKKKFKYRVVKVLK